ncbi:MAG: hypothetical protein V4614_02830 [Pseudomonadota bacterium]
MFDRLKKVLTSSGKPETSAVQRSADPLDAVGQWAVGLGFAYEAFGEGKGFAIAGKISGKPFKLERGRSSRDYIRGEELRARGEIKVNDDASVLVMNRPLKEALEKKAYQMYTDTLQTTADPSLPEEMRWLAMYPEAGWDGVPEGFWDRYSVLADQKEQAQQLVTAQVAELLMSWPVPAPDEQVPFMLMVLRGKSYLRMQYTPEDLPTLQHAMKIFTTASEAALTGLVTDISV